MRGSLTCKMLVQGQKKNHLETYAYVLLWSRGSYYESNSTEVAWIGVRILVLQ